MFVSLQVLTDYRIFVLTVLWTLFSQRFVLSFGSLWWIWLWYYYYYQYLYKHYNSDFDKYTKFILMSIRIKYLTSSQQLGNRTIYGQQRLAFDVSRFAYGSSWYKTWLSKVHADQRANSSPAGHVVQWSEI